MIIQRAYKVELDPNNVQKTDLLKHAGTARKAYNWGLKRRNDHYKLTGKSISTMDLNRELNLLKNTPKENGGFPWMYEVSKCTAQEALWDLDKAFENFYRRCADPTIPKGKKGFPKFKKRSKKIGSFHLTGAIRVTPDGKHIQLPKLGKIKLKEVGYLPKESENTHILSATVSEKAGHWFVSLATKETIPDPIQPTGEALGIDVGISHLATLSDGTVFENPRALKKYERRLRILQKSFNRKKKGSNNRRKAKQKVTKLHFKIANIRKDSIQKATSIVIAKRPKIIGIETLNVSGMLKNHKLAKSLSDASMSEFHRETEYKAKRATIPVAKAGSFFPSSKLCSRSGERHPDLKLGDRIFKCPFCGLVIDRDLNAALNLKAFAESSSVVSPPVGGGNKACGAGSSGLPLKGRAKLFAKKQESNIKQGDDAKCLCLNQFRRTVDI